MMHPKFYSPFYRNFAYFSTDFHSHNPKHVNISDAHFSKNPSYISSSSEPAVVDNPNFIKSSSFFDDDFLILLLILFLLLEQSDDYPLLISLVLLLLD